LVDGLHVSYSNHLLNLSMTAAGNLLDCLYGKGTLATTSNLPSVSYYPNIQFGYLPNLG
jgi:hypothetical protein